MNAITEIAIEIAKNILISKDHIIEKSRDDRYIIRINKDRKAVYIGSKYSADRDITNLINKYENINIESTIIVFGLGTGEYICEMLNTFKEYRKIIVIEPDINVIKCFLSLPHSQDILNNDKFFLCLYDEETLKTCLLNIINEFDMTNINIETYTNYNDLYRTELSSTISILKDVIMTLAVTKNTIVSFSNNWYECYLRNLIKMFESSPINCIHNTQNNRPAIIVSAGPSLEKNIELLKDAQENFIIITGGRTLKTLLDIGVKPDLLCIIDAGLPSYQLVENNLECDVPLLFFEYTNVDVVEKYTGKKIFFNNSPMTGKLLNKDVSNIYTGGSVAHTCVAAAAYMGCNPIIFIGQDFAYTGEKLHASIAELGEEIYDKHVSSNDIFVDDVYGNKVRTSIPLNIFRKQMEFFIKLTPEREFINATEGGANIHNTKVMDLKDAINIYGKNNLKDDIRNLIFSDSDYDINYVVSIFEKSLTKLRNIKFHAKKGMKYANKLLMHYSGKKDINLNKVLIEMDKIDLDINNEIFKEDFINYLLYPVFCNVFTKTFSAANDETEMEKGKRIGEKNKFLYDGIYKTIDESLPLIESIIKELNNK